MITEARERATGMVAEAQEKRAEVLQGLGRERNLLQKKVDELRTFERDYRARLKSYLEGQLHELEVTAAEEPAEGEGDGKNPDQRSGDGQNGGAKNGGGKNGAGNNGAGKNEDG